MRDTVVVTGFFKRANFGDDLFEFIYDKLQKLHPVLQKYHWEFVSTDSLPHTNTIDWKRVKSVILAGGDVLNEYFVHKIEQVLKTKNYNGQVIALSCGIPYTDIISEGNLNLFSGITVRSKRDHKLLKFRYQDHRVRYRPDISCLLKTLIEPVDTKLVTPNTEHATMVGVCLARPIVKNNNNYTNVIKGIAKFIDKIVAFKPADGRTFEVVLIPFNTFLKGATECDHYINRDVVGMLKDTTKISVHTIDRELTTEEMFTLFQRDIDIAVTMRYHAHMLALVTNTPIVSIGVTPKVKNLQNDLQLPSCAIYTAPLDHNDTPTSFDADKAIERFKATIKIDTSQFNQLYTTYLEGHGEHDFVADLIDLLETPKSALPLKVNKTVGDIGQKLKQVAKTTLTCLLEREPTNTEIHSLLTQKGTLQQFVQESKQSEPLSSDFIASLLCLELLNTPFPKYHYGLAEKVLKKDFDFSGDLKWVWKDHQKDEDRVVFEVENTSQPALVNATYVGTEDFKGCHRSGWQYVLEHLRPFHSDEAPVVLDNYIDRTFHWAEQVYRYAGVIPFRKPWIGFVHHTFDTTYTEYNVPNMFKKKSFLDSLPTCKAIFTLSKDLETKIRVLLDHHGATHVKTANFVHPTEIPERQFDFHQFADDPNRKIVQVGAWLRDSYKIYQLEPLQPLDNDKKEDRRYRIKIAKAALKGRNMNNYFPPSDLQLGVSSQEGGGGGVSIALSSSSTPQLSYNLNKYIDGMVRYVCSRHNSVEVISTLDNDGYDNLLSKNIVFLYLVDASAVNVIIECMVRNTPVLVNRLPSIEEVLGINYPFFYDTMAEANVMCTDVELIRRTHMFLKSMNKRTLTVEHFTERFKEVVGELVNEM